MNDFSPEYKIKLGKVFALLGCLITVFIPFVGIFFLIIGIVFTYKQENLEMKHIFCINIIALISNLTIFIITMIQSLL